MAYYTYILSNPRRTVLYIGVCNDINRRISEHKLNEKSFAFRYCATELVYYESYHSAFEAIEREKQLKNWRRIWKWALIKRVNPELLTIQNQVQGDNTSQTFEAAIRRT